MKRFFSTRFRLGCLVLLLTACLDLALGSFFVQTPKQIYKKVHCINSDFVIELCPNVNQWIQLDGNEGWFLRTNSFGERIVSEDTDCNIEKKEIWLLGDSIAMGYKLPDEKTIGYLIEKQSQFKVRILAVDAIGTNSIRRLLEKKILRTKKECLPYRIYWLWNPSDFIDDEIESRRGPIKKFLYLLHFELAKYSFLYSKWLDFKDPNKYQSEEASLVPYPEDHITYKNLENFASFIHTQNIPLTFVFFWGMGPDGNPDNKDPNFDAFQRFANTKKLEILDLRLQILPPYPKDLYIAGDGHPDIGLNQYFKETILTHTQKKP